MFYFLYKQVVVVVVVVVVGEGGGVATGILMCSKHAASIFFKHETPTLMRTFG